MNLLAALAATIVMFAVGGFWYTVPFQKAWSRIMGFDKLSKKEQSKLMQSMAPVYLAQLLFTALSAWVLTYLVMNHPDVPPLLIASFVWLGFVLPAEVSAVLFSRTEEKYRVEQIAIMGGESLVRLLLAAWVISLF